MSHYKNTADQLRIIDASFRGRVLQMDLDNTILTQASGSTSSEDRADNFFQQSYERSQALTTDLSSFLDGVSLLLQVAEPMTKGRSSQMSQCSVRSICFCTVLSLPPMYSIGIICNQCYSRAIIIFDWWKIVLILS